MEIKTLCTEIGLQLQMTEQVLAFAADFDFAAVEGELRDFRDYGKMEAAYESLREKLGEDPDGVKLLACMLHAGAGLRQWYREQGLGDEIYIATMKCYPRFLEETRVMTGRLCFDRGWWTTRQAGGHLFRIGQLEYERKPGEDGPVISIHIPSDADFSPEAVDRSLEMARRLLPEREYICDSWLLDRQLAAMLPPQSNIVSFQNRFEILEQGDGDNEFMQWLFHREQCAYDALPEDTSLQRKVKAHLLAGGVMRSAMGRMTG